MHQEATYVFVPGELETQLDVCTSSEKHGVPVCSCDLSLEEWTSRRTPSTAPTRPHWILQPHSVVMEDEGLRGAC